LAFREYLRVDAINFAGEKNLEMGESPGGGMVEFWTIN
jgi:hypothetical protein